MTSLPRFYSLLKSDRDDASRASAFDAWLAEQPRDVQRACGFKLWVMTTDGGLSETGAKAMLAMLILFIHDEIDEQDKRRAHGEAVRQAYEWTMVKRKEVNHANAI